MIQSIDVWRTILAFALTSIFGYFLIRYLEPKQQGNPNITYQREKDPFARLFLYICIVTGLGALTFFFEVLWRIF